MWFGVASTRMVCATLTHSKEQTRTLVSIVRIVPDKRTYLLQDLLYEQLDRWVLIFLARLRIATQLIVPWISWTNQVRVSYLMDDDSEDDIVAFPAGILTRTANFKTGSR